MSAFEGKVQGAPRHRLHSAYSLTPQRFRADNNFATSTSASHPNTPPRRRTTLCFTLYPSLSVLAGALDPARHVLDNAQGTLKVDVKLQVQSRFSMPQSPPRYPTPQQGKQGNTPNVGARREAGAVLPGFVSRPCQLSKSSCGGATHRSYVVRFISYLLQSLSSVSDACVIVTALRLRGASVLFIPSLSFTNLQGR